ncbi:Scr1 family TA system antitoxin-like transcriptional regulator [Salininema proteolyticum]|uniref:Scr1 family TA system antitoxin-like transcriptional regulator n=1 Tax=Salininema proteolyticum TaxID=1607685 RepID=A0ABV8U2T1_9ACTN
MGQSKLLAWALATELRALRDETGLSLARAGALLERSSESVRKWETGENAPDSLSIDGIARRYKQSDDYRRYLLALRRERDSLNFFSRHVFEPRILFLAEQRYPLMRKFEPMYIPGVLQIKEYHYSDITRDDRVARDRVATVWSLIEDRQKVLFNRSDLRVEIVIGQAALQFMEGHACRDDQIERLREAVDRGWSIQVMPTPNGLMKSGFDLYLSEREQRGPYAPSFAYYEAPDTSEYVEEPSRVENYEALFDTVQRLSKPLEEYLC